MTLLLLMLYTSFLLSLLGLSLHRTHLMLILICIEGMMLTLYLMMTTFTSSLNISTIAMLPILLLAMSACEASTGLALLVATSRTHGTDHMKTLNLLKC
uniref:NADH-ubiquinone oxidoreductase chain 4L n=1 Tax=Takydromus sylvaticus TaxID=363227 RepID=S4SQ03_9SAUR|nr:NADH dehydrogenase subunit 4L [Takydromus sylvaticus]AFP97624.1 NADH dehydrogenase subunit 4L [Takydromus sylvaticus]UXG18844.1 NADH dehydrogenase subunit 4L [Takydromus sylvaticus]